MFELASKPGLTFNTQAIQATEHFHKRSLFFIDGLTNSLTLQKRGKLLDEVVKKERIFRLYVHRIQIFLGGGGQ